MSGNSALMVAPPFPPEYRASGLLLHVTSLPSPYGVGDLGSSAFSWIDRLHDAVLQHPSGAQVDREGATSLR